MDPADFLDAADRFQNSLSEAERRTSIGRSYYALYNVLVGALSLQGVSFSGDGKDHGNLVHYLIKCGDRQASKIGGALRDLRNSRNDSDYRMHLVVDVEQSQFAYGKAKQAIERFHRLPTGNLQRMIQAMKRRGPRS